MVTMLLLILLPAAFLLPPGAGAGEIVGGREAEPHSRPYMAYLQIQGGNFKSCGGFLVADNAVLSAAHCQGRSISVILGAHNIDKWERSWQVIRVQQQILHPHYDNKSYNNDIMMLQLAHPPKASDYVKALALPHSGERVHPGSVCSVAGWGFTVPGDESSLASALREVDVDVLEDGKCRYYKYNHTTMLCAGDPHKGKDSAGGDSGGPLVCGGKAQGIVSWGTNTPPGVYTRVSYYTHWIQDILRRWKP
ncbi:mast cell protease 1A-like [Pelodiscus sinensis]|uniref:mast cell protease 1A-like n=1 Tax=Pelodiscus sinensis TaxID=13735 RepID=UPI003F6D285E